MQVLIRKRMTALGLSVAKIPIRLMIASARNERKKIFCAMIVIVLDCETYFHTISAFAISLVLSSKMSWMEYHLTPCSPFPTLQG